MLTQCSKKSTIQINFYGSPKIVMMTWNMRNRQTLHILLQQNPASFEDVRFTCEAVITNFDDNMKWKYASCSKCSKGSVLRNGKYFCENHGKQDSVTYRYNFKPTVSDGTTNA